MFLQTLLSVAIMSAVAHDTFPASATEPIEHESTPVGKGLVLSCVQWQSELEDIQKKLTDLGLDTSSRSAFTDAQTGLKKILQIFSNGEDTNEELAKFRLAKAKLYLGITRSAISRILTACIEVGVPDSLRDRVVELGKKIEERNADL